MTNCGIRQARRAGEDYTTIPTRRYQDHARWAREYAAWCRAQVSEGKVRGVSGHYSENEAVCRLLDEAEAADARAAELEK